MIDHFTHDSHQLTYETFGSPTAPPLIMVHGWLSHRGVWRQTTPILQDRFYCVALDLLGFGDSDKPAEADYGIAAQADRVVALADHLGFQRFSLIGHSMGGQICAYLAARTAPQRVTQLISVGGVVMGKLMPEVERMVYPLVNLAALYPPLMNVSKPFLNWLPYARIIFHAWFHRMDAIPFDSWEIDRRMALRPAIAKAAKRAGQAIHDGCLIDDLPQISAPTLGIYGRNEGTVPFADAELLQRLVPGAQLAAIDNCGHFPMYEQTSAYLAALTRFLQR